MRRADQTADLINTIGPNRPLTSGSEGQIFALVIEAGDNLSWEQS
jgi:hypothetical protein